MSLKNSELTRRSKSNVEQRKSVYMKAPDTTANEEIRAEKARKLEQFLIRSTRYSLANTWSSRFESNIMRHLDTWCPARTPGRNDDADVSLHPSYRIIAHNSAAQYRDAKEMYNKQLQREMAHLIENQRNVYDQCRLKSILCYRTLWPPLHTKQELNNFVTKFFQLTPRQKKRVDYLMKTNLS